MANQRAEMEMSDPSTRDSGLSAPAPLPASLIVSLARPWSLALRLTVWYAATAFLLVAAVAWVQYRTLRSDLAGEDDQLLLQTLAATQSATIAGTGSIAGSSAASTAVPIGLPTAASESSSALFGPVIRVLDIHCHVFRGANPIGGPPPVCNSAAGRTPVLRTWISPSGRTWRIATQLVVPPVTQRTTMHILPAETSQSAVWIEAALDRWTDVALLAGYRGELGMLLPAALLVSALLGFLIARRGLAPLRALAGAVSRIDAQSLDHPMLLTGVADKAPTEVAALVASFETMRERLNRAFAALTQFSTELAHEFRTPIHIMMQQAEIALSRSRTPGEYRDVLASSLEELDRLHHMVDDILFLARAEDPRARINRVPLAIATELADIVDYLEPLAAERGVAVAAETATGTLLSADRMLLRRALVNVVNNAIRHTPSGGRVTLTAEMAGEGTAIEVRDTGTGIPVTALPRVFDRYFRVPGDVGEAVQWDTRGIADENEAERAASGHTDARMAARSTGTGLGLAIVRSIMSLHGGTASIRSTPGRGTWVTLHFPLVRDDKLAAPAVDRPQIEL